MPIPAELSAQSPGPHPAVAVPPRQVQELRHRCIIYDAWRGMRHVVQLRAREEFGHGSWSAWSQEATGTPWTGTVAGVAGMFQLCRDSGSRCEQVSPRPRLEPQPIPHSGFWEAALGSQRPLRGCRSKVVLRSRLPRGPGGLGGLGLSLRLSPSCRPRRGALRTLGCIWCTTVTSILFLKKMLKEIIVAFGEL